MGDKATGFELVDVVQSRLITNDSAKNESFANASIGLFRVDRRLRVTAWAAKVGLLRLVMSTEVLLELLSTALRLDKDLRYTSPRGFGTAASH